MRHNRGRDPRDQVAVVGMAARFPHAPDLDSFWQLLCQRGDAIGPVPPERWDTTVPLDPEQAVPEVGGFLDGVDAFEPTFFGISPRAAPDIDPQQRLMLEAVWRALEDAGEPAAALRGSRTGVYVGASWHDYELLRKERQAAATPHSAVGNALDVIAARVSYFLELSGPSLVLETGCSSSLVALHLAVQALRTGEIEAALVGGVNLILAPDVSIGLTHFGGLSPEGRCRAFAEGANGFVRAEGVTALYLKRLDRAVADGDPLRGVVVTTAVNNDGGGESLVTPHPGGQEDLLRVAYQGLDIPLEQLRYIEAHGTGTGRGDPVEAGAIGRVLGQARDRAAGALPIGSVKTNIGHTEATAGLAGVMKALLAIEHREVPPNLHADRLNPEIDFTELNLQVLREPLRLPADQPVYIGVNSFGWGGTNAHVVLGDPPPALARGGGPGSVPGTAPARTGPPPVLAISAHSPPALDQRIGEVGELVRSGADVTEVAGALAHRRDHFPHRVAVVAPDAETTGQRLAGYRADPEADLPGLVAGRASAAGRVAFAFPGQGAQWAGMGRSLLAEHPTFAEVIERCADALKPHIDWDLAAVLAGTAGEQWLSRVDMLQPALWAMSVGLAELWREAGVRPDVVVGHSQGEVAAATVAGMLSYRDAATIIARRSALARRTSGQGRMLAVGLDPAGARAALAGFEEVVSLAAHNSAHSCVLSGETEAVLVLKELLDADGVFCRLVDVDYASHSPQMDPLLDELRETLGELVPRTGEVPLMSTVRGASQHGPELDAGYWAENLRRPVLFQDALTALFEDGVTHVVEISPHPVLANPLEQLAQQQPEPPRILSTLRRDQGSAADLAEAFARGYVSGLAPFAMLPPGRSVRLPGYPWQRTSYWPAPARRRGPRSAGLEVSLVPSPSESDCWQGSVELAVDDQPWLGDHRVHDAVVVPGAALLALALRAGQARAGRVPDELSEVVFHSDLTLTDDPARITVLWRDDAADGGSLLVKSLSPDGAGWTTHLSARVRHTATGDPVPPFPEELLATADTDAGSFYADCAGRGLHYGPAFQGVQRLHVTADQALARLQLPARCQPGVTAPVPHPALWDAALQASLALQSGEATVVPTGIDHLATAGEPAAPATAGWGYALRRADGRYDVHLYDDARQPLLSARGLVLQELVSTEGPGPHAGRLHRLRFVTQPRSSELAPAAGGRWLVCGDAPRVEALAEALAGSAVPGVPDLPRLRAEPDLAGVAYLAPAAERGLAGQRQGLSALAELVRGCLALPTAPRLAVLTTGAQAVRPGETPDPGGALFWGFTRVLRREHAELTPTLVDVSGAGSGGGWAEQAAAELIAADGDDQVVLRDDQRYVGRLLPGGADEPEPTAPWRVPAQPFRLVPAHPGQWDGLQFRPLRRRPPKPGEVELEVSAASLNFIDVMKAMGTYPDPAGAEFLGGECAGTVTAVGEQVAGLRVGDRVVACGFGALASHLTLDARQVRPIPAALDDPTAAALPLVTITAWYGLAELARLGPGETVLIHSAAGGLGLAAIGVARQLGAEILATAGTEEKRRYLREQGITQVFDSRDLTWHRQVMEATGGRGVDVVLNSLTGAAIELGLGVLAEDGRFIEVGKRDIHADRMVGLGAFRKGISFAAVDLAGLMQRRPERFSRQFTEVWNRVTSGELPVLPVLAHRFAEAAETLRSMARGTHIGKFVLTEPASVESVTPEPMPAGRFRPDGTYLVTGGLGALGLSLAEFFADRGAGALALLGRSAPGAQAQARLAALQARGVRVHTYQVDVTDRSQLAAVLADVRDRLPQLRGVVHAAGVLADATVANLRADQVERVISPKVDGARHLDELTSEHPLDLFVLFSSAAALVGNAGQAAYAAGNAFLDGLAEARRRRGLPGLSIQWGPFAEVGLAAADGGRGDRLAERGMGSFSTDEAWEAFAMLLEVDASVIGYVPLDVRRWFDAYPDTAALPSWQALRDRDQRPVGDAAGGAFLAQLHGAAAGERESLVEGKVRELTARVLRMDGATVDRDTPFKALGLDSLLSLELRNRLEAAFDLRLSPTLLWTYGTVAALTKALCERVAPPTA